MMGRSPSHITLECANLTQPNVALIGEEIEAKRMGVTRLEDYEKVKREISAPQLLNERALLAMVGLC